MCQKAEMEPLMAGALSWVSVKIFPPITMLPATKQSLIVGILEDMAKVQQMPKTKSN
jgi:hypothetical protein